MVWEPRFYRRSMSSENLVAFRVVVAETDLMVHAERDMSPEAEEAVRALRSDLEHYISTHPRFAESFVPLEVEESAPQIVRDMALAASATGVGPMAAVAGAFAEAVARVLSADSPEVIVENGGDVYVMGERERVVALWAGGGEGRTLGLRLAPESLPCAVATSSGTIGPSVSLGSADAATVVARHGVLADAAASVVGNRVHGPDDIRTAIEAGRRVAGVEGIIVSVQGVTGAWGAVEFVDVGPL